MSDKSQIEWTEATWNPVVGCTKVSPGCDHCYAETWVNRFAGSKAFPETFDVITDRDGRFLDLPLRWSKPRRIFVNSLSDLFHADVPDETIAQVFAVMAVAERHTFQLLTKRHARMRNLLNSPDFQRAITTQILSMKVVQHAPEAATHLARRDGALDTWWPLTNVWLGVSVEDQHWADIRIPALLDTPAAVRWISAEPLLGPLDLQVHLAPDEFDRQLDWVVVGGESGPGARPMHPSWPRDIEIACSRAQVPFLFKQWGNHDEHGHNVGKKKAGRELDGRTHDGYPQAVSV